MTGSGGSFDQKSLVIILKNKTKKKKKTSNKTSDHKVIKFLVFVTGKM